METCYHEKKSRIRETKHLLTDADSSTDTPVGWTKNTQKQDFFKYGKNHPKRENSKTSRNIPKLAIYPSIRGLLSIGKCAFRVDQEYPKNGKNHPKRKNSKKRLEIG